MALFPSNEISGMVLRKSLQSLSSAFGETNCPEGRSKRPLKRNGSVVNHGALDLTLKYVVAHWECTEVRVFGERDGTASTSGGVLHWS